MAVIEQILEKNFWRSENNNCKYVKMCKIIYNNNHLWEVVAVGEVVHFVPDGNDVDV